jgi:tagatose 6-phosphate kinase
VIVTVTLNLALDVTYTVPEVRVHAANRVSTVAERAGGKGVNVARVLQALGLECLVCGFAGGHTGDAVREELSAAGLNCALTTIAGESRRTLAVVDEAHGDATGFWEPGPEVAGAEWRAFLDSYDALLADADAVVLCGSLPPGVPADAYAVLGRRARAAAVPAVLDADGDALRRGLAGRPELVKPNRDELARVAAGADPIAGAEALREAGAGAVVVSDGHEGLTAVAPEGRWRASPPERVQGNPTGAGDAAVAALTAGLVKGLPWPERVADAAALSAAAVGTPLAGDFDPELYRRYRDEVIVVALDAPSAPKDGTAG